LKTNLIVFSSFLYLKKEKDISEWNGRLEAERASKKDLEVKMVLLCAEIDRNMMILRDISEQNENLKADLMEAENRHRKELEETQSLSQQEIRAQMVIIFYFFVCLFILTILIYLG
jgi:hypothetical protein